ncbi:GDSL esterase/lipase 1-like [Lycium barbarum]|uniref:GDSL esterase/lipase 1-like n=1 Tax=Lycium barbarum TaxID=112863 RepID=UPI00293F5FEC|nr:GDSL esterase/lipase 1-like [Lycium barbarum]
MRNLGFHLCILIFLACFNFPIGCFDNHHVDNQHVQNKRTTNFFVFGDSMFDPGNNNYLENINAYRANFKPYGESYFEHPTGRFSDGRLIPDFIAKFANLPMIPSYYQALHNRSFYGVNFASGGAGCLDETYSGKVISLNTQLGNFKTVTEKLKAQLGKKDSEELLSNAIYLFSVANNDYLRLFDIPDMPSDMSCLAYTTEQEYMNMVMDNFVNVTMEIYKLGGRKFGIQNLLPLGCLPRFRGLAFLKGGHHGDCLDELNSIVKKHNLALLQKFKQFKKQLRGFEYSYFNMFDALNELFENPSTYGFTEAKSACCGFGPYRGFGICGVAEAYELCKNVKEHVIFDSYHPTEKAFHHFAQVWWQGNPNLVEPQSLKSLLD